MILMHQQTESPQEDNSLLNNFIQAECNMDAMNRAGKCLGINVDIVPHVKFKHIAIYDSIPVGASACGDYVAEYTNADGFSIKEAQHLKQTEPIQIGFSDNMNQRIASETGQIYGSAIWVSVAVTFKDAQSNINGGAPEVCVIRSYEEYETFTASIEFRRESEFYFNCIAGDVGCFGDIDIFIWGGFEREGGTDVALVNHDQRTCNYKFDNSTTRVETQRQALQLVMDDSDNNDVIGDADSKTNTKTHKVVIGDGNQKRIGNESFDSSYLDPNNLCKLFVEWGDIAKWATRIFIFILFFLGGMRFVFIKRESYYYDVNNIFDDYYDNASPHIFIYCFVFFFAFFVFKYVTSLRVVSWCFTDIFDCIFFHHNRIT